jgi:protein gp37
MSEHSKIAWTDSTWNPWRGCSKVSAGCDNCYAETLVTTRLRGEWGPGGVRVRSKDFLAPIRWNRKPWVCDGCGCNRLHQDSHTRDLVCDGCETYNTFHRRRVFSPSLGDWLEGQPLQWSKHTELDPHGNPIGGIPIDWLADMLDVIRRCDQLEWILCTKRPENFFPRMASLAQHACGGTWVLWKWLYNWEKGNPPKNITVLASIEDQKTADERIPALLKIPAACHGLSLEPLLGPIDLSKIPDDFQNRIRPAAFWLICGGESGPKARPCNVDWIRDLVRQGKAAGVPVFVKQLGAKSIGIQDHISHKGDTTKKPDGFYRFLNDQKGSDPSEWPEDLRVREFPYER